jgi:HK97 family phage major capsid protein
MARDIMRMKRERAAIVQQMRTILDAAEARSDKKLTSDEETRYTELNSQVAAASADIEREERQQQLESGLAIPGTLGPNEIRSFGDFLAEARFNPGSPALQQREVGGKGEKRDMSMGSGPSAGFLIPEEIDTTIRAVTPNQAIFRPRATVIPAGTNPDAAVGLIALDQSGSLGVYSGVTVQWIAEGGTRPDAGDPQIRQIKIEPQEVSGYIDVTDKLLRNSAAAGALVQKLLRGAIIGSEENAFFVGSGVGKPLGIGKCGAAKKIARTTASTVVYTDVINMFSACKMGGQYVWVASQTVLPKLMAMKDEASNLVWQPNARDGAPSTLLGIPLIFFDQSPILGQESDLALVDLQYYAIKDGSPLAIFMDPYTQKVNGITRIYAFWNVDGQPMLSTPLMLGDGVTTVSPFVILK